MRKVSDKTFFEAFRKNRLFWANLNFRLTGIVFNLKLEQRSDIYWLNRLYWLNMLLGIIFLNSYPISRAAGAMYQSARGNAIIRVSNMKS